MSFIEWKDIFDDVFEDCSDKWILTCVHRNDTSQFNKLKTQHKMERTRYARFHCPKCSNGWASAKAMVWLFYPRQRQSSKKVTLRFFGQECRKCSRNNNSYYVDPEFENDWIQTALEKLYAKFRWVYYNETKPEPREKPPKENNIEGPHKKELCEACKLGYCDKI